MFQFRFISGNITHHCAAYTSCIFRFDQAIAIFRSIKSHEPELFFKETT